MADSLPERIQRFISGALREADPSACVEARPRPAGLVEIVVISPRFEAKGSIEREEMLWPVLRALPREDRVRMAYSLLLTPDEAARYYRGGTALHAASKPSGDSAQPAAVPNDTAEEREPSAESRGR